MTVTNPNNTLAGLQENVAIAAVHLQNKDNKYILSPITIEQAFTIGNWLWIMGYRKTFPEAVWNIPK